MKWEIASMFKIYFDILAFSGRSQLKVLQARGIYFNKFNSYVC